MMKLNFALVFFALTALATSVGCGEKLPYPVASVQGTATYQGKPLPQGMILQFLPVSGEGRPSEAVVGKEGKFKAVHSRRTEGVQVGKMVLKVAWLGTEGKTLPVETAEILKKYDGRSAGFPVEITKSDKEFNIDLK